MEAIVTVFVLSLVVSSGALMYSLLTAEKPKPPFKFETFTFIQKVKLIRLDSDKSIL